MTINIGSSKNDDQRNLSCNIETSVSESLPLNEIFESSIMNTQWGGGSRKIKRKHMYSRH